MPSEWRARHLHAASALRISGPCTVCAASYLPLCPVRSLFSGASTHCGTSLRFVSQHLTNVALVLFSKRSFVWSNEIAHDDWINMPKAFVIFPDLMMSYNSKLYGTCVSCSISCHFMFSEPLLAGLPQTVKFTVLTGHESLKKGNALQLSNTDTMPILPSSSCTAHIRNPAAGECSFERVI